MRKILSIFAIVSLFVVFCMAPVFAYHYPEGLVSPYEATMLDNGFNYSIYNQFYNANTFKDANGNTSNLFDHQFSYQMINKLYYLSNFKLLGANLGFGGWLPVSFNSINSGFSASGSQFGIGDIYLEPLMAVWKGDNWNVLFNSGVFLSTGIFQPSRLEATGEGYVTGVFGLGGNVFLDDAKTWNVSAITRYRLNSAQQDTNITYGDSIGLEAEISKSFAICKKDYLSVGVLGYGHQQVNSDRGSGVLWDSNDRQNLYGVGPVTRYTFYDYGVTVGAKGVAELGATNHTQGFMGTLFVSKTF